MSTHRTLLSSRCTTAAKRMLSRQLQTGATVRPFLCSPSKIQIKQFPKTISHMSFSAYTFAKSNNSEAICADNNLRI